MEFKLSKKGSRNITRVSGKDSNRINKLAIPLGQRESQGWSELLDRKYGQRVQFSPVAQSRSTLCDPMNRSTPGLPVHHHGQSRQHEIATTEGLQLLTVQEGTTLGMSD